MAIKQWNFADKAGPNWILWLSAPLAARTVRAILLEWFVLRNVEMAQRFLDPTNF